MQVMRKQNVCKDFEIINLGEYHGFVCSKRYIILSWCIREF